MKRLHGGGDEMVEVERFSFAAARPAPDRDPVDRRAEVDASLRRFVPDGRRRGPMLRRLEQMARRRYGVALAEGLGTRRAPKRKALAPLARIAAQGALLRAAAGALAELVEAVEGGEVEARLGLADVERLRDGAGHAATSGALAERVARDVQEELHEEQRQRGPQPYYVERLFAAGLAEEWQRVTGRSLGRHNRTGDDGGPFPEFVELVGQMVAQHYGGPVVRWPAPCGRSPGLRGGRAPSPRCRLVHLDQLQQPVSSVR